MGIIKSGLFAAYIDDSATLVVEIQLWHSKIVLTACVVELHSIKKEALNV